VKNGRATATPRQHAKERNIGEEFDLINKCYHAPAVSR
jgi:hypothetical protein